MKLFQIKYFNLIILISCFGFSTNSLGQVDPFWLKSWNEAQANRPKVMTSSSRIAPKEEPGVPLVIHGQVFAPDGHTPAANIVVHSYYRDKDGFDFGPHDTTYATWRLQGWVLTDAEGRFEFHTIRPSADHLGREGPHLHFTVESADRGRQWAPIIYFAGDPLLSKSRIKQSTAAGKFGFVREIKTIDKVQHVDVNIRLKEKADF